MPGKWLICVVGPTGSGKTALAIELARHFNTAIVSADSRQFYKEMQIGTAVPTPAELSQARHYLVQHKSVEDSYSVGDFEKEALDILDNLFEDSDMAILAGGSGLYVDAVVRGLDSFPEVHPSFRNELVQKYQQEGIGNLQEMLAELDPDYHARVDLDNHHRLIRALEVCLASGKPYSSFLGGKTSPRQFKSLYIGIKAEREVIYRRINDRVDAMVEAGLVEEARHLLPYRQLNALQTVGYKELFDYFDGETDLETAISEIKKNSRRYAKRQLTWLRKNKEVHWVELGKSFEQAIGIINTQLKDISNE